MIPQAYITEWSNTVSWQTNDQVEQDLVICRALIHVFSDKWLAQNLAFRGGTALHKLYLSPQPRYSEDIDLVQIHAEPIKETVQRLQQSLSFLGNAGVKPRKDGIQLIFHFESEFAPVKRLRLKVEANTREHFTALGFHEFPFAVNSSWFKGNCNITTYKLEELLGTKLRALYQRKKGRDLFDIYTALSRRPDIDLGSILQSYQSYMDFSQGNSPTQRQFILNMEAKMKDSEFLGDTKAILRPDAVYDPVLAYATVRAELIEKI